MVTNTPAGNCPSCGGKLILNFKDDINKCEYCGNEYAANGTALGDFFTGYVPFSINSEDIKKQVLHWLTDGDFTPADILTTRTRFKFEPRYIPAYIFEGEYAGSYNILNHNNDATGESTPLNGKYEVACYAGTRTAEEQPIIETHLPHVDTAAALPLADMPEGNADWATTTEATVAWGRAGNMLGDQQVLQRLNVLGDTKNYRPAVNYHHTKTSLLYMPFYHMPYTYNGQGYVITANGQTGEIFGERPIDRNFKMPTRWGTFWKRFALGWLQWFAFVAIYVMVMGFDHLAMSKNAKIATNTLSVILTFGIPIALATFLFGFVKKAALAKLRKKRKQAMEMILTGRQPSPFA